MHTVEEILAEARRLPADQRRRVAEELLDQIDQPPPDESAKSDGGPYARWLQAAGSVRADSTDLSTDKYEHVAASILHGHDEA